MSQLGGEGLTCLRALKVFHLKFWKVVVLTSYHLHPYAKSIGIATQAARTSAYATEFLLYPFNGSCHWASSQASNPVPNAPITELKVRANHSLLININCPRRAEFVLIKSKLRPCHKDPRRICSLIAQLGVNCQIDSLKQNKKKKKMKTKTKSRENRGIAGANFCLYGKWARDDDDDALHWAKMQTASAKKRNKQGKNETG